MASPLGRDPPSTLEVQTLSCRLEHDFMSFAHFCIVHFAARHVKCLGDALGVFFPACERCTLRKTTPVQTPAHFREFSCKLLNLRFCGIRSTVAFQVPRLSSGRDTATTPKDLSCSSIFEKYSRGTTARYLDAHHHGISRPQLGKHPSKAGHCSEGL